MSAQTIKCSFAVAEGQQPPDLFRVSKCKEEVGVSRSTLHKWHQSGWVKFYHVGSRAVFASRSQIHDFIVNGSRQEAQ